MRFEIWSAINAWFVGKLSLRSQVVVLAWSFKLVDRL